MRAVITKLTHTKFDFTDAPYEGSGRGEEFELHFQVPADTEEGRTGFGMTSVTREIFEQFKGGDLCEVTFTKLEKT